MQAADVPRYLKSRYADPICVGHTAAVATWFATLGSLPARAQRICTERLLAHGTADTPSHALDENETLPEFGYALKRR